jgi:hypothetical protein
MPNETARFLGGRVGASKPWNAVFPPVQKMSLRMFSRSVGFDILCSKISDAISTMPAWSIVDEGHRKSSVLALDTPLQLLVGGVWYANIGRCLAVIPHPGAPVDLFLTTPLVAKAGQFSAGRPDISRRRRGGTGLTIWPVDDVPTHGSIARHPQIHDMQAGPTPPASPTSLDPLPRRCGLSSGLFQDLPTDSLNRC